MPLRRHLLAILLIMTIIVPISLAQTRPSYHFR